MSSFLSPQFVIGSIRIGSVENAACINMGNNWPTGFESHQKLTQGFGSVSGDRNVVSGIRSLLNDSDFLDMLNITDAEVPDWLQKAILSAGGAAAKAAEPDIGKGPA
ncbi:hypothetical protein ACFQI7_07735 [Paenibacillus allorhizosphaerae]|uniref:Spore germination protein n=1 Tax=Paenibacillus allorhizosphaerae TaxID=2849866 RepID=A0ABM8VG87_9BACL|nr:hypothetical protein [Paenibacillus allorhizosphaerae]CAG7637500.1 hypothetical protein PAECIP111802_02364 [Paenibacillus allorhizosphaerae]